MHANNSRDAFDSGADRHANLGTGDIEPEAIAAIVRAAGCDVLVETPAAGQAEDISYLRSKTGEPRGGRLVEPSRPADRQSDSRRHLGGRR